MVITDIVHPDRRADVLGKLGLFYGIGMVIGPALGGQITKSFGYVSYISFGFLLVLGFSLFCTLYPPAPFSISFLVKFTCLLHK